MTLIALFREFAMSLPHPPFTPAARGGLSSLLLLSVPLLLGADDNFLREIEDEARRQAAILITTPPPAPSLAPDTSADRLEAGLDPATFEQALRRSLPGTYTVYQQLNTRRKQQLYQAYQNNNQLTSISERAAQLLSGKP
ncbi:MAG: hypothetical protein P9F75_15710 [Candidatus Contendobacter sp.]|nr:hypothetical protein [Candidatus Contendobacter sp.]